MNPPCHRIDPLHSRREFLSKCGCGFGALAFGYMLGLDGLLARASSLKIDPLNPLSPRPPHFPVRAKSIIWLFMEGGPSHLDLFDPKPALDKLAGQPSLGAWTTYGLGSANDNLPTFVVMADGADPVGGPKNWSAGFLPATFEGTQFRTEGTPIFHLRPPRTVGEQQQRSKLDLLADLNRHFSADKPEDSELTARLNSYELAYRMQAAAPEAVDLSRESELTRKLYGLDEEPTRKFGTLCLLSRRLVERGVRFVQLYCGSNSGWDAHVDIEENHSKHCRASDKPIAGLLADLKARGMLEDTLVVWGGEFGRTPFNEKGKGRDHNPWGFTMWFAGGGTKPGTVVGSTDEIGLRAVEDKSHVLDIHATILHTLGLNSDKLTYLHNGRDERATINDGQVITKLLA